MYPYSLIIVFFKISWEQPSVNIYTLFSKEILKKLNHYGSITRMELLGFPDITPYEIKTISALLNQMTQLTIDRVIEDKTIHLKQKHCIKLPDAIILATAKNHQVELLTLDKKLTNKL